MEARFISLTEQVAMAIRDGLQEGRWKKTVPGRNRLARELGVNHKTVQAALSQLEREGLLKSQGPGKQRLILDFKKPVRRSLRVIVLPYEKSDLATADLLEIVHRLQGAGHLASFATKTLVDLDMNVKRLARFVEQSDADAWVVLSAPRDILDWFAAGPVPAFALFGRIVQLPMASTGPKKGEALQELVDRLYEWGHRRIVMLAREERRKPTPGAFERIFLEKLKSLGIPTGAFNLPDWGDSPEDLRRNLNSLFRNTPPTAVIIDDPGLYLAAVQHLARLGIVAPDQVSLACTDYLTSFEWCRPEVTHLSWNFSPAIKRIVNWVNQVSRGKNDRRMTLTKAKLVLGGTTGPAPRSAGSDRS